MKTISLEGYMLRSPNLVKVKEAIEENITLS